MSDLFLYSHPFSSYCQKVLTAFYEKDLPFRIRMIEEDGAIAELKALWPFGKFPILLDGDRMIAETTIIIEYLDRIAPDTSPMIPRDPETALRSRFFDRVIDTQVQNHQQACVLDALRPEDKRDPYGVAQAKAALDRTYVWLDAEMKDRDWAAGDAFSLADCSAAPALLYADWTHPIPKGLTALWAYRDRLLARPSYARALEEARPYRDYFPLGAPVGRD